MTDKDLDFYSQELPSSPFNLKISEPNLELQGALGSMRYPCMTIISKKRTDFVNKEIKLKLLGIDKEITFNPDIMENIVILHVN